MGRVGPLEPTAERTAPRLRNDDTTIRCCVYSRRYPTFYMFESLPFLATTTLLAPAAPSPLPIASSLLPMVMFTVTRKETVPFDGQKPGTSGLRKKVRD
ncbi:hypothetical protein B296_00019192 [Ensete ventricosum]|uniref:Uncharacterized protein n=1 Tax=Ensete ventricosum TaxID=4639 RepID=A0A427A2W2_ENSVE|nr:hypothetical protein B296_00019192 [Ensete ventricosum]